MSCLMTLKQEIEALKQTFTENNERFQVLTASLEELSCCFIGSNGEKYAIQANIVGTYPSTPPIWFAETEEASITDALQLLTNTSGQNNHVVNQVDILVRELCRIYDIPLPPTLGNLKAQFQPQTSGTCPLSNEVSQGMHQLQLEKSSDSDHDDLDSLESENDMEDEEEQPKPGPAVEYFSILKRIRDAPTENRSKESISSSVRLMKELHDIYHSDSYENDIFSVELVNDSLYEWNVRLKFVDPDSQLHKDLVLLKQQQGEEGILLNITFKETYPFDPPFVGVVYPVISDSYVMPHGAICMELLTNDGWRPGYTIEAVILQIATTIVTPRARVNFQASKTRCPFNLELARRVFKQVEQKHAIRGWGNLNKRIG
ncbi:ubiquitin-conjugating enzyme E2 Q2-like [Sabethes cyaneus]|uniref:ubiquitin-conjugating enzyme E2 Q2-like n=1 Tax=Sabethes cyaneus TaxID=53552 RepID=UPI00237E3191|nr:ubiquitin-conjugating enzyme E2 Q2-like [Sabethes cyaneus]